MTDQQALRDAEARTRTALGKITRLLEATSVLDPSLPAGPYDEQELRRIQAFLDLATQAIRVAIREAA